MTAWANSRVEALTGVDCILLAVYLFTGGQALMTFTLDGFIESMAWFLMAIYFVAWRHSEHQIKTTRQYVELGQHIERARRQAQARGHDNVLITFPTEESEQ